MVCSNFTFAGKCFVFITLQCVARALNELEQAGAVSYSSANKDLEHRIAASQNTVRLLEEKLKEREASAFDTSYLSFT